MRSMLAKLKLPPLRFPAEVKVLLLLIAFGTLPFAVPTLNSWMNHNANLAGWGQAIFTVLALVGGFAFPYLQHRRRDHQNLYQQAANRANTWQCVEGLSHDALDSLQKELLRAANSQTLGSRYLSSRRTEESIAVLRSLLSQPLDPELTVAIIRMQRSLIAASVKLAELEASRAAVTDPQLKEVRDVLDRANAAQEHIVAQSERARTTLALFPVIA